MRNDNERYFVGLASGSAAAGVHAVLAAIAVEMPTMRVRQVRHHFAAYQPQLRERILAAQDDKPTTAAELARLKAGRGSLDKTRMERKVKNTVF